MRVILNADDFGSTERHTRRILELLSAGKISSTSFLVNLPYSETAATLLRDQHPQLLDRVGLHFNLTEGRPLNVELLESPFVDQRKNLKDFRGRVPFVQQLFSFGALRRELNLQIERFHALMGRYPTHIDSHGHTHCTWVMLLALLFSKSAGRVKRIRLTRQYDHDAAQMAGMKNKLRRAAKMLLNMAFKLRFRTTNYFTDIRNMDGSWLRAQDLEQMRGKFKAVEIMCHPYYLDESEYEFLRQSPNLLEQVPGLQLISYSEL